MKLNECVLTTEKTSSPHSHWCEWWMCHFGVLFALDQQTDIAFAFGWMMQINFERARQWGNQNLNSNLMDTSDHFNFTGNCKFYSENHNKLKTHATETNQFITEQISLAQRMARKIERFIERRWIFPTCQCSPIVSICAMTPLFAVSHQGLSKPSTMPHGSEISCMRFFTHVAIAVAIVVVESKNVNGVGDGAQE